MLAETLEHGPHFIQDVGVSWPRIVDRVGEAGEPRAPASHQLTPAVVTPPNPRNKAGPGPTNTSIPACAFGKIKALFTPTPVRPHAQCRLRLREWTVAGVDKDAVEGSREHGGVRGQDEGQGAGVRPVSQ